MNTTSDLPASSKLASQSCDRCAVRKVKCDKQQPCTACSRHNVQCEYRILPKRRRRRKPDNDILNGRLEQYQRPLHQKDVPTGNILQAPNQDASSVTTNGSDLTINDAASLGSIAHASGDIARAKLIHDDNRSKYNNGMWKRVVEELADSTDALGHSSDEDADEDAVAQDNIDFTLGLTLPATTLHTSHPSPPWMLELWAVYMENFDPLTKIVHPTLQSTIQRATTSSSLSKGQEALSFAIYAAAIVSLSDDDCQRRFSEPRQRLLSHYRQATKAALSRAKLMGSTDLAVLQAFLIHLLSTREVYDSRTLWNLTGVALRIAEGMGLHRDGALVGLSPLETEMRRRIWWQLKLLDGDSAEASGSDKFGAVNTDPRSTKLPTNLNDNQLSPDVASIPMSMNGATDMIFCSLRFDLRTYWTSAAAMQASGWPWITNTAMDERDKALDEFESFLETKYIRYCDPSQPLHLLATLLARTAVSTSRLIAHHPRNWRGDDQIPDSERRYVWDLSIKSIKQYNSIHTNGELQRFSWHAAFYFRWHAFIHILDTLRANPLVEKATEVWQLIEEIFVTNPDFVKNTKKPLYVAVGKLCLKAYHAREGAFARAGTVMAPAPSYINEFRKQWEAATARRETREADTGSKEGAISGFPIGSQPIPEKHDFTNGISAQLAGLVSTAPPEMNHSLQSAVWSSDLNVQLSNDLPVLAYENAGMEDDMLLDKDDSMDFWVRWDALLGDFT